MYVILVNDDDTLYGSHKERIMQRSKLVDNLVFIVDPIYRNVYDMTNASVILEYILPVSRKYETINLVLSEEKYNDCYLQYKLPFDTNLTSEAGSLEMQLTFAYTELDENGNGIQHVRKTSPTIIEIIPISAWSDIIPDSALSALDQRLIKIDAQMRELDEMNKLISDKKADNIKYDEDESSLQLMSGAKEIGDKVILKSGEEDLKDGVPIVDLDGMSGEDAPITEDNDVIEF